MSPFAYIHRPAILILDFYETSGFRTGRSVKHDIHKHDFIMRRGPTGGNVGDRVSADVLRRGMSVL